MMESHHQQHHHHHHHNHQQQHYDTATMAMLPVPLPAFDPHSSSLLTPLDSPDHLMTLEFETLPGCDMTPQRPHELRRFTTNYEDSLSDVVSNYETNGANPEPLLSTENLALDRDNKLLSFSTPTQSYALLDYTYRRANVSLAAQLHGMFCLGDAAAAALGEEPTLAPLAVTCYRRNLFSISGSISMPRSLRYILTDNMEQIPVVNLEATVSATESIEGHPTKMISVPFKSIAKNIQSPDDKADREPTSIPLDLTAGAEIDPEHASIPLSWTRLQFRNSTANNGRRKELQQHFTVTIRVMALLSTGQSVSITESSTNPIVVRGRSPRNFQNRKEPAPTSGSISSQKPPLARVTSGASTATLPPAKLELSVNAFNGNDIHNTPDLMSPDVWDWRTGSNQHGAMTALPPDTFRISPEQFLAHSSPDLSRTALKRPAPPPVNLSLTETGFKQPQHPRREGSAHKTPRLMNMMGRPSSFSLNTMSGSENDESADLLYEYFPLGLDDWQEPVDAVYRPHVVHHIQSTSAPKASAIKSRSKRYFSEDVA